MSKRKINPHRHNQIHKLPLTTNNVDQTLSCHPTRSIELPPFETAVAALPLLGVPDEAPDATPVGLSEEVLDLLDEDWLEMVEPSTAVAATGVEPEKVFSTEWNETAFS